MFLLYYIILYYIIWYYSVLYYIILYYIISYYFILYHIICCIIWYYIILYYLLYYYFILHTCMTGYRSPTYMIFEFGAWMNMADGIHPFHFNFWWRIHVHRNLGTAFSEKPIAAHAAEVSWIRGLWQAVLPRVHGDLWTLLETHCSARPTLKEITSSCQLELPIELPNDRTLNVRICSNI